MTAMPEPMVRDAPYEGLLVIDKESGPTSHDVVARLRRALGMRRIGHCGTLDPLATGVLVVCLGRYTRLSEWLSAGDKEYLATFLLGATSDTDDIQGEVSFPSAGRVPSREEIETVLRRFEGEIDQVPPVFSAVKVRGVRSYKLARRQQAETPRARRIRIDRLQLVDYAFPHLQVQVACSKGTYIRSLAADIGRVLGCGGLVEKLRRQRSGSLDERDALTLSQVERDVDDGVLADRLVPLSRALREFPEVGLSPEQVRAFAHGNLVTVADLPGQTARGVCAVYAPDGQFCGIGEWAGEGGSIQPRKVFHAPCPETAERTGYDG